MDVYLESPFASELLLYGRFSLFRLIGFFCRFFVSSREHGGGLLSLNNPLVEPLRLFHPFCSVLNRAEKI